MSGLKGEAAGGRALFYDRQRQSVDLAVRSAGGLGVLNLNMDGLKPINDRYGHRAGDAAIKDARNSRRVDTAARVGGD